ncbi:uncharacterized protein F4807DRAFT_453579 [Annulohypoxylon truncatum]|uniref:uncharacterized protein n=1 Tax=Annulohypoxylon truncatum TaxID=327061 RepID=UPI002008B844|nr:uncharacterized protein F4807DRAFT_453579 [Annulohypoxylon truncatum]KAI1206149.1 hypothetical protein F4807DRAFT_453579 [Annulohypoxylon truncatum]
MLGRSITLRTVPRVLIRRNLFRNPPTRSPTTTAAITNLRYSFRDIKFNNKILRTMATFSNTDTGDKPSGPYYNKNIDNDVTLKEKVETLTKFVSSCKFGMMTTHDVVSGKLVSRCMAVAGKEGGDIDLTFTTNTESHKTDELKADKHTNISFCDSSGQWASFAGNASIETDRDAVKKFYSSALKAWLGDLGDGVHDGSENDPRIGVLRVKTSSVTYAITDKTLPSRMAEVAKGTITGEPAKVNKLREISEDEVRQWRATAAKKT